jgi:transcriptional regulator GlxA family with amidase domain
MSARADPQVQSFGFLLLPGFALMSFAAAVEPLRAANHLAGRPLYDIAFFGEGAVSSIGVAVAGAALPRAGAGLSTLFVCAGGGPADWRRPDVLRCLRRLAGEGVRLGGISGGPYLLAEAGLLEGRRFTIHWEHAAALGEAFPQLRPEAARFVIDRDRVTCGGGVAPLDLMHALITERMGGDFAGRVSDWFLHTRVEPGEGPQRASLAERFGVHHPALLTALEKMAGHLEKPLSRAAVARAAGVSERQLDRLFSVHRGCGFLDDYHRLRLEHARRLLRQSALSVSEIAFATGYSSVSHFGRAFRRLFGATPGKARAQESQRGGPAGASPVSAAATQSARPPKRVARPVRPGP